MTERDLARWIVAGVFGGFWLLMAVTNASIALGFGRKSRALPSRPEHAVGPEPERGQSMVPFIGGLAGAVACLASPHPLLAWAWVPLVLDAGSVPMVVLLIVFAVRNAFGRAPKDP